MDRLTANTFVPMFNLSAVRSGETPSGNGLCSARGLAALGTAMTLGGRVAGEDGGSRLMREETVAALHDGATVRRDAGIAGAFTEFSQGGVNYYRWDKVGHRTCSFWKQLSVRVCTSLEFPLKTLERILFGF